MTSGRWWGIPLHNQFLPHSYHLKLCQGDGVQAHSGGAGSVDRGDRRGRQWSDRVWRVCPALCQVPRWGEHWLAYFETRLPWSCCQVQCSRLNVALMSRFRFSLLVNFHFCETIHLPIWSHFLSFQFLFFFQRNFSTSFLALPTHPETSPLLKPLLTFNFQLSTFNFQPWNFTLAAESTFNSPPQLKVFLELCEIFFAFWPFSWAAFFGASNDHWGPRLNEIKLKINSNSHSGPWSGDDEGRVETGVPALWQKRDGRCHCAALETPNLQNSEINFCCDTFPFCG